VQKQKSQNLKETEMPVASAVYACALKVALRTREKGRTENYRRYRKRTGMVRIEGEVAENRSAEIRYSARFVVRRRANAQVEQAPARHQ